MRSIISAWVVLSAIQLNAQAYFSTTLGDPFPFYSAVWEVIQLPDSGYLAAFDESEFMNFQDDLDLLKFDKFGNMVDHKKYGSGDDSTGYAAGYISKISDSLNLVIAFEYTGTTSWNSILLLTNNEGDSIRAIRYSHPGAFETYLSTFVPANDGNYYFLGQTDYYDSTQHQPPFPASFDFKDRQLLIVKMDSAFNVVWTKEYGKPTISESALDVILASDGGLIAAGRKYDYDKVNAYIFKFDAQGNIVWQQGWLQTGQNRAFSKIIQTKDGNYLACGPWNNNPIDFPNDQQGEGGCLMKIKPNGQFMWQKEYRSETDENNFYDMVQLDDGSLVLVGYEDYDNITGQSDQTAKLSKLDADGNVIWNRTYDYFEKTRTTAIEKLSMAGLSFRDGRYSKARRQNHPSAGF